MSALPYDAMVRQLVEAGVPRERAEAAARAELGQAAAASPDAAALEARDEKRIVAQCDKQLRALGFTVWNLSQPRASKISPGIPDRLYTHSARGVALFWEAKTATGRQRPDQRVFQEHADAVGWPYILGTDQAVYDWLVAQGIAFEHGGLLVPLPPAEQVGARYTPQHNRCA